MAAVRAPAAPSRDGSDEVESHADAMIGWNVARSENKLGLTVAVDTCCYVAFWYVVVKAYAVEAGLTAFREYNCIAQRLEWRVEHAGEVFGGVPAD